MTGLGFMICVLFWLLVTVIIPIGITIFILIATIIEWLDSHKKGK